MPGAGVPEQVQRRGGSGERHTAKRMRKLMLDNPDEVVFPSDRSVVGIIGEHRAVRIGREPDAGVNLAPVARDHPQGLRLPTRHVNRRRGVGRQVGQRGLHGRAVGRRGQVGFELRRRKVDAGADRSLPQCAAVKRGAARLAVAHGDVDGDRAGDQVVEVSRGVLHRRLPGSGRVRGAGVPDQVDQRCPGSLGDRKGAAHERDGVLVSRILRRGQRQGLVVVSHVDAGQRAALGQGFQGAEGAADVSQRIADGEARDMLVGAHRACRRRGHAGHRERVGGNQLVQHRGVALILGIPHRHGRAVGQGNGRQVGIGLEAGKRPQHRRLRVAEGVAADMAVSLQRRGIGHRAAGNRQRVRRAQTVKQCGVSAILAQAGGKRGAAGQAERQQMPIAAQGVQVREDVRRRVAHADPGQLGVATDPSVDRDDVRHGVGDRERLDRGIRLHRRGARQGHAAQRELRVAGQLMDRGRVCAELTRSERQRAAGGQRDRDQLGIAVQRVESRRHGCRCVADGEGRDRCIGLQRRRLRDGNIGRNRFGRRRSEVVTIQIRVKVK